MILFIHGLGPEMSQQTNPSAALIPPLGNSVGDEAERLRFLAPSPLSSPVAALVTGEEQCCR